MCEEKYTTSHFLDDFYSSGNSWMVMFGSLDFQTLLVLGPLQKILLPLTFRSNIPL